MRDVPLACALPADELGRRRQALLPGLAALAVACRPLANGREFTFAPDSEMLDKIVRTIDAERHCCPFLNFRLTVEEHNGPVTLVVTGPPGTAEFLDAL